MHPSSFYDLRARYVYTPLHGPYSLSEALEGLIFYSLDISRDFISFGSKSSLRHELILELSNVVDDLQDYLAYFSSTFLISPPDSLDLIKELQTNFDGFKYPIVCWGALITRLVTARQIVECNFWPHFFQPAIDNLADLQRLGRLSSVSPNAALDKLSMHASALVSPSCTVSAPYSPYGLFKVQCQSFDARSPQTMRSKSNPTVRKEDRTSSRTLDSTPTLSGPFATRIPSDLQSSVIPLQSHFPKNRSDEVLAPWNCTVSAQRSGSSTSTHSSNAREPEDLRDKAEVVGANGQDIKEQEVAAEEEEVTQDIEGLVAAPATALASSTTSQPMSTASWPTLTTRAPATTSSPTTALRFASTGLHISHFTTNFQRGRPYYSPSRSFAQAIPQPPSARLFPSTGLQPSSTTLRPSTGLQPSTALRVSSTAIWPSPTAPQVASRAPCIPCSALSPNQEPTLLLPRSSPRPRSFANANSWQSTYSSSREQRAQRSIPSAPFPSHSTAPKRPLKTQRRRLRLSPVHSPTTPPFQQYSFSSQSIYPPSDIFQPQQDDQWSSEESPSPVTVDDARGTLPPIVVHNTSDASSFVHDAHSIPPPVPSHDFYSHSSSRRLYPSTPFSAKKRRSFPSPPFHGLGNTCGRQLSRSQPCTPMVNKGGHTVSSSTCQPTPSRTPPSTPSQQRPNTQNKHLRASPVQAVPTAKSEGCTLSTTNAYTPLNSCSSTSIRVGDTRGLGRLDDNTKVLRTDGQVSEGLEGVTDGEEATRMSYAHTHPVQLNTTHRKLVMTPARTVSSSAVSRPTSKASHIPNSTVNPHWGPSIPLPRPFSLPHPVPPPLSFANANSGHSTHPSPEGQHAQRSVPSAPFHSLSVTQKQSSKVKRRRFVDSPVGSSTPFSSSLLPPFRQLQSLGGQCVPMAGNEGHLSPNDHSISPPTPSGNLDQHPVSHLPYPSTCFFSKRPCSSLPPPFHRLNGLDGQHDMQHEQSRIPPFRAAPTCKSTMSPSTPDTHAPFTPLKTWWPSPDKRDEQRQTNAPRRG